IIPALGPQKDVRDFLEDSYRGDITLARLVAKRGVDSLTSSHDAYAAVGASTVVIHSSSRFRRNNRARCARVFTSGMLSPRVSAISAFDRPSMSRRTSP